MERPPRPRRAAAAASSFRSLLDDPDPEPSLKRRKRTPAARQRETEVEAMLALSLGFPIDALLDGEPFPHSPSSLNDYIVVRNHILSLWRRNVRSFLTKSHLRQTLSSSHDHLLSSAYDFLLLNGHINFGVSPAVRAHIPDEADDPPRASVLVVGAGLSGLAAASQLRVFGFRILVLEARARPGGRVYTHLIGRSSVELGGSVITGIHANPLGVLARQLGIPLHKIRDSCPLYHPDGTPVSETVDAKVEAAFNKLLEQAAELRGLVGEDCAGGVSLGEAIEKIRRLYGVMGAGEESELLNWHLANLEYANAGCLPELSWAYWDQDDPYEMDGDHCFLAGGNRRLVNAMCENLPILYGKKVESIKYGEDGVEVVAGSQEFKADMVLCTVPLGVLKKGDVKFEPELPAEKIAAIGRLGFGLLNKVAMVFPYVFWGEDVDTFGCLNRERCKRGEFFLFYSYHTVSGGPVLIALLAGKAASEFEQTEPTIMLHRVLGVLRGIFTPKGISVPNPVQTICTRWGSDPLSYGSYSHVRVGSCGKDYDILAQNVMGRLFFAGEATSRQYPATMHGAFLSGLREASSILCAFKSRETTGKVEIKKSILKTSKLCFDILQKMFRWPDMSCGNFEFVFNPSLENDPRALGIVRFTLTNTKEGANDHPSSGQELIGMRSGTGTQNLHLYTIVSREQAANLLDFCNDDPKALYMLCRRFSLQLMGSGSLCTISSSLITSIAKSRKTCKRRHPIIIVQHSI